METEICSPIKSISKIKYKRGKFEWWGPSPDEARRIQVSKPKDFKDKRTTLRDAVRSLIKDDQNLALGGFVNIRIPVAIVHEIIRQGAKNLTLSFHSQSFAVELLFGAMIVDPDRVSIKRVEMAYVAYENVGLAPLFRYLAEHGMIEIDDYSNYGMAARFKAGAMGVPCLPVGDQGGSDMELVNRGRMAKCPFSGKNIYFVPACHPDVGLIHAQVADEYGNCRLFGPLGTDPEIALASTYTIITAEKTIPSADMRRYPNLTEIPYVAVDAVVHQPYGAYPGLTYGFYWFDMEHRMMFRNIADEFRLTGRKDKLKEYYDKYIFSCETFDDYMSKIPYCDIRKAEDLDGGQPVIL